MRALVARESSEGGKWSEGRWDPWLIVILVLCFVLGIWHIAWGLPNGNNSWAADAPGPLTVINVWRKSTSSFNSGWFWYKYPLGYPLLLLLAYLPYLAYLLLTGGLSLPSSVYPFGLEDPETTIYVLALIGRGVNLLLILATVALTYCIARRLIDRWSALFAAWIVATSYPFVFYAHTTNQDAAYLFWLVLALWAAIAAAESSSRKSFVVLGIAAAMAMATKEQGFALLLVLPLLIIVARLRQRPVYRPFWTTLWEAIWNRGTLAAALASVVTFAIAANAIINPLGVWNRIQDLRGHPVPGLSARLTPVQFSLFKGWPKELQYLRDLIDVTSSSLGLPLFLLALAGILYLFWRHRWAAFCLFLPAGAYYLVSLRTHDLLTLRYALPLIPILSISAGAFASFLWQQERLPSRVLIALLCLLGLARAVELDSLLVRDARYDAEAWIAQNIADGAKIEVYQKPVYLPRVFEGELEQIDLNQRTIEGIVRRRPEFLILSSLGKKRLTHYWHPDWRESGSLLVEDEKARGFIDALLAGELPYQVVANFDAKPIYSFRSRITSLNPSIVIYQRKQVP